MRSLAILALVFFLAMGCGERALPGQTRSPEEDHPGSKPAREAAALKTETLPLGSPTSVVGFGGGSLWIADLGDYRCDDTPGVEASCATPEKTYLKRLDPKSREVLATIPLRNTDGVSVAFGAGAAWISYENYSSPSKSGVLRLDLETNQVVGRVPLTSPGSVAFGEGAVWVTDFGSGTLTRIDPHKNAVAKRIEVGGDLNGVAAGDGAVWVAGSGSQNHASVLSEEDYERGTLPEPAEDAKLSRVDPRTSEVVAEIPIEASAIEGGASSVSIDERTGAVWATSVNGKLFRVDPRTNEVTSETDIGDYSFTVEVGAGSVWAVGEVNVNDAHAYTRRLTRVAPASNNVSGRFEADALSGLAVGDNAAWLGGDNIEDGRGGLTRVSP